MTDTLADGPRSAAARIPFHLDMSTTRAAARITEVRAELVGETDPERRAILLAVLAAAHATLAQSRPPVPAMTPTSGGDANRVAAAEALADAEDRRIQPVSAMGPVR